LSRQYWRRASRALAAVHQWKLRFRAAALGPELNQHGTLATTLKSNLKQSMLPRKQHGIRVGAGVSARRRGSLDVFCAGLAPPRRSRVKHTQKAMSNMVVSNFHRDDHACRARLGVIGYRLVICKPSQLAMCATMMWLRPVSRGLMFRVTPKMPSPIKQPK